MSKPQDKYIIVPTHRGRSKIYLFLFNYGQFLLADSNHRLLYNDHSEICVQRVVSLDHKVLLSPLHNKSNISFKLLFKSSTRVIAQKLVSLVKTKTKIEKSNKEIATWFFRLAISNKKFPIDSLLILSSLRTLGDVYGYDVRLKIKKAKSKPKKIGENYKIRKIKTEYFFYVKFTRPDEVRLKQIVLTDLNEEVGSCTVINAPQAYINAGLYHRNTGGDAIRILICRLEKRIKEDPEFGANVKLLFSVHDEVDVVVKKDYWPKFVKIDYEYQMMNGNGKWPIKIEPTFALSKTNWGEALDFKEFSDDGKILDEEWYKLNLDL